MLFEFFSIMTVKLPSKKEISNPELKFKYVSDGDEVIDQLPRVGEYVEAGSTIVIMLG